MPLFSLEELEAAVPLVRTIVPPTPQHAWPLLARRTGAQVWVKHENHTPIGAFKVRGGIVYLDALKRREAKLNGVVTATRGNHGQSIALAAARAGMPCTIFVPRGNSREKNAAMQAFGAELVVAGADFDECRPHAARFAEERGYHYVPVVPCGPGEGRRHLRAGAVPGRARARCGLRADRHGLGHLRPHHGARSAGAQDGHHRRRCRQGAGRCLVVRAGASGADQLVGDFRRWHGVPRSRCRADRHHLPWRGAHRARDGGRNRGGHARLLRGHAQPRRGRRRRAARSPDAGARANAGQARRAYPERRQYRPRGVRRGSGRANTEQPRPRSTRLPAPAPGRR